MNRRSDKKQFDVYVGIDYNNEFERRTDSKYMYEKDNRADSILWNKSQNYVKYRDN